MSFDAFPICVRKSRMIVMDAIWLAGRALTIFVKSRVKGHGGITAPFFQTFICRWPAYARPTQYPGLM